MPPRCPSLHTTPNVQATLKRKTGLQLKAQKPDNITEAENQVLEMEMWLKESQSLRQTQLTQPTPNGHFEFNRMPFGLKNAPATFQRMIHGTLKGLNGKICFVYLDDVDAFETNLKEHNNKLMILFERLRLAGFKLQPDKCEYHCPELEYLGHLITAEGVKPNPVKIQVVRAFREARNIVEVQSFLGLDGYYRKFIKISSALAKPLTELTKKETIFD